MLNRIKSGLMIFGLFCAHVSAQSQSLELEAVSVSKNVYSVISPFYGRPTAENNGWNSNSHFIITTQGVLVFDSGSSEHIGNAIIAAVKRVTEQPIRWVVNSHSHADHWLGNAAFAKLGAELISTSLSAETMKSDGPVDVKAFFNMTKGATGESTLAIPTSIILHQQARTFGDTEVEFVLAKDGHSPGDVMLWLPKQRILIGGDVVNSNFMPIMTPRGNITHLISVLKEVKQLSPLLVLTGHGENTSVKSVSRDIQFLTFAWNAVHEALAKGTTPAKIQESLQVTLRKKFGKAYQDFDTSISYLLEMMIDKQQLQFAPIT
ncbi:MBL fold metallo-hydrolase [Pseudoalteromonas piscicida]|uniref:MBL fold metallo-hydrolase n=1 Tax=Pseudoalteromonas piscicida TaxID=43662 RepID=UPI0027391247|nr:MBL fold metallo-hydrolase [Pseudoalteromonas piscicida]MDP4489479.1 MBL fold metallo-hydrolase [Pseudoalteromonas piscicida]